MNERDRLAIVNEHMASVAASLDAAPAHTLDLDSPETVERGRDDVSDFTCPACHHYRDTPMHELGCDVGRRERITEVVSAIEGPAYERGLADGSAHTLDLDSPERLAADSERVAALLRSALDWIEHGDFHAAARDLAALREGGTP